MGPMLPQLEHPGDIYELHEIVEGVLTKALSLYDLAVIVVAKHLTQIHNTVPKDEMSVEL
jgi:hypothetical protein